MWDNRNDHITYYSVGSVHLFTDEVPLMTVHTGAVNFPNNRMIFRSIEELEDTFDSSDIDLDGLNLNEEHPYFYGLIFIEICNVDSGTIVPDPDAFIWKDGEAFFAHDTGTNTYDADNLPPDADGYIRICMLPRYWDSSDIALSDGWIFPVKSSGT